MRGGNDFGREGGVKTLEPYRCVRLCPRTVDKRRNDLSDNDVSSSTQRLLITYPSLTYVRTRRSVWQRIETRSQQRLTDRRSRVLTPAGRRVFCYVPSSDRRLIFCVLRIDARDVPICTSIVSRAGRHINVPAVASTVFVDRQLLQRTSRDHNAVNRPSRLLPSHANSLYLLLLDDPAGEPRVRTSNSCCRRCYCYFFIVCFGVFADCCD